MGIYLCPGDRAELLDIVQARLLDARARAEASAREEGKWMRIAVSMIAGDLYPADDDSADGRDHADDVVTDAPG